MKRSPCAVIALLTAIAVFTVGDFARAEYSLIANGGFETGDLSGWTVASLPLGTQYDPGTPAAAGYYAQGTSGATPVSGLPALLPASGTTYALADMTAQSSVALIQSVTVPLEAVAPQLSFDMYVYDWYGAGRRGPAWTTARRIRSSTRGWTC